MPSRNPRRTTPRRVARLTGDRDAIVRHAGRALVALAAGIIVVAFADPAQVHRVTAAVAERGALSVAPTSVYRLAVALESQHAIAAAIDVGAEPIGDVVVLLPVIRLATADPECGQEDRASKGKSDVSSVLFLNEFHLLIP